MQSKNFAIVALIMGILGFFTFCIPIFGIIVALTGVIFGVISLIRAFNSNEKNGLPITGLTISIFALILAILFKFGAKDFWKSNNDKNLNFYDDSIYVNNYDNVDTNAFDLDSALLENKDFNNLKNSNKDFNNGPGNPPN